MVAGLQVEVPAGQKVQVDLFAGLSFAPDGVEDLEEKGFEEPFRRHAGGDRSD